MTRRISGGEIRSGAGERVPPELALTELEAQAQARPVPVDELDSAQELKGGADKGPSSRYQFWSRRFGSSSWSLPGSVLRTRQKKERPKGYP